MALKHIRGLVLRMDPVTLREQGARCTRNLDNMTSAQHNFVCIDADAKGAWWLPLSAAAQLESKPIPASAKSGDRRWAEAPSYYLPDQCWYAPHKAAQLAAAAAHDRTDTKSANTIAVQALPEASDFPDLIDT